MVVVTSTANPAVKAARKLARRHGRARAGEAFLVEGPQAVREAGKFLQRLFATPQAAAEHADLIAAARSAGAEIIEVGDDVLAELTTTVTTQGLIGVAAVPAPAIETVVAEAELLVVLHQVRDPGNAGTAIRTADAAGADGVVLTAGSVDAHNAKAVRASAGSVFHLPVVGDIAFSEVASECAARGLRLVAASGDGTVEYTQADLSGRVALVFGNEAHGLPAGVKDACAEVVRIPLAAEARHGFTGTAESLNLAATAAILTFECVRQQAARRPRDASSRAGKR